MYKVGDLLRLLPSKDGLDDNWIFTCQKKNKEWKDTLCCITGQSCRILKVFKTTKNLYLKNELTGVKFKFSINNIGEDKFNFKKI